jgi:hypothetical protein
VQYVIKRVALEESVKSAINLFIIFVAPMCVKGSRWKKMAFK